MTSAKRMINVLALIAALLAANGASARIGETAEECIRRYGKPVDIDKENHKLTFHKSGLYIWVRFSEGQAHSITYQKSERNQDFSDDEIQLLLKANDADQEWRKPPGSSFIVFRFQARWITEDDNLFATHENSKQLQILTKKYREYLEKKTKADAEKQMEGF